MAFHPSSRKRLARIFLIGLTLGMVAAPVVAAPIGPLQYQSARGLGGADGSNDANSCDPQSGRRHLQGQGAGANCDAQPKYSLHNNGAQRRPAASAFGLQFDTEAY